MFLILTGICNQNKIKTCGFIHAPAFITSHRHSLQQNVLPKNRSCTVANRADKLPYHIVNSSSLVFIIIGDQLSISRSNIIHKPPSKRKIQPLWQSQFQRASSYSSQIQTKRASRLFTFLRHPSPFYGGMSPFVSSTTFNAYFFLAKVCDADANVLVKNIEDKVVANCKDYNAEKFSNKPGTDTPPSFS